MVKITITAIGTGHIEINYGDFAPNFDTSNHVLPKADVSLRLSADKTKIEISFSSTLFKIDSTNLAYIQTNALTVEEFFTELKSLI